jgi:hypothetical protein
VFAPVHVRLVLRTDIKRFCSGLYSGLCANGGGGGAQSYEAVRRQLPVRRARPNRNNHVSLLERQVLFHRAASA